MSLSIVIVSWNTIDLLERCLASVYNNPPQYDFEVIVVDNNSRDGSLEMVRREFPQVILVENKENKGFAGANNQAIRRSTKGYVLLLNPDTEVKPDALHVLVYFMEAHPEVGAAGARVLNPDGTLQTSCYPVPTLSREFWRLLHLDRLYPYGSYRMADWDLHQPRQVEALLGACILLRRSVLDRVGLMDEKYFMYSEELDLCYRIRQAGWPLHWVPQAQIIHYGGQSTQQVAAHMFIQLYHSKIVFVRKHYGQLASLGYKLLLLVVSLLRLLISPLVWFECRPQRQRHLTLAGLYWKLVRALPGL